MSFTDPQNYDFPEWVLFDDYFYYSRDIVSFGDELTVENLTNAYEFGIFPWHVDGLPLPWYCPEKRAILEFSDLHIPRSLERARRKNPFTLTIDKEFRKVIQACATQGKEAPPEVMALVQPKRREPDPVAKAQAFTLVSFILLAGAAGFVVLALTQNREAQSGLFFVVALSLGLAIAFFAAARIVRRDADRLNGP